MEKEGKRAARKVRVGQYPDRPLTALKKWIKLIKLVCNLHGPSNTPATDTHRD